MTTGRPYAQTAIATASVLGNRNRTCHCISVLGSCAYCPHLPLHTCPWLTRCLHLPLHPCTLLTAACASRMCSSCEISPLALMTPPLWRAWASSLEATASGGPLGGILFAGDSHLSELFLAFQVRASPRSPRPPHDLSVPPRTSPLPSPSLSVAGLVLASQSLTGGGPNSAYHRADTLTNIYTLAPMSSEQVHNLPISPLL